MMAAQRIVLSILFGLCLELGGVADAQFQPTLHGEPDLTPLAELPTPHINEFLAEHGKNTDLSLNEIFSGENDRFRRQFYMALRQDSSQSATHSPKLIDYLVYSLTDESGVIWQQALLSLSHDEEDAYSDASRDMLRRMKGPKHSGGWTRLLGAANISEVIDYARDYLEGQERAEPGSEAWLCLLVLAKYGVDEAIEQVIQTSRQTPDWFNHTSLPRDLLYIKQPEVIDLYLGVLFSDEIIQHDQTRRIFHGPWSSNVSAKLNAKRRA